MILNGLGHMRSRGAGGIIAQPGLSAPLAGAFRFEQAFSLLSFAQARKKRGNFSGSCVMTVNTLIHISGFQ